MITFSYFFLWYIFVIQTHKCFFHFCDHSFSHLCDYTFFTCFFLTCFFFTYLKSTKMFFYILFYERISVFLNDHISKKTFKMMITFLAAFFVQNTVHFQLKGWRLDWNGGCILKALETYCKFLQHEYELTRNLWNFWTHYQLVVFVNMQTWLNCNVAITD